MSNINYNKIDWNNIEKKWSQRWDDQKIFQTNRDLHKKKYFITVAYPYPNSPQHVGHGRTYTLADSHARYMRMKGYNVLFPMGFHYTGTPILAMSRRVSSGDRILLETFTKIYNVPSEILQSFTEPVNIANYFHNEIKLGMKEIGLSIDWRREFTTIDEAYSKFISWQFKKLHDKKLIMQGSHPVGWCPNDQNPVSQHDTIGDVEPNFVEYILIKFELDDGCIIPVATLRPETIFGCTNLWVNPQIQYVRIIVDDNVKRWIVSREAARKLEFLNHKVVVESVLEGKEIIGKYAKNPVTQLLIPVYPASYVDSDNGTGIVMSVPAHAPYDYQALQDLKNSISDRDEFGLKTVTVDPLIIIGSQEYPGPDAIPALRIINKFNVKNQSDPRLEKSTSELYSHEYYSGIMLKNTGKYEGMPVQDAKEKIKSELVAAGIADRMFELTNKPVRCRCGAECVVKLLVDQWFLNYGDNGWKNLAYECIKKMDIIPEEIRHEFEYVINWLRERACARKSGLGTVLPWDSGWIIESLSDSTIYMAYYILAKYINDNSISNVNALVESFFDYVLLGIGNAPDVAEECDISKNLLTEIRNDFSYFYPVDSRHSGRDLVPNHLSFFIFNHVAIFQKKDWPRQIVVNGSVLMEGKKMSKSIGNIIPLRSAIKEHGADVIRVAMLISAELLQDADFSFEAIKGIRSKLEEIYYMAEEHSTRWPEQTTRKEKFEELEDRWLISRLQRNISDTTLSMDRLRVRQTLHNILYALDQDLQWYRKRAVAKKRDDSSCIPVLYEFLEFRIRMLAPFAPFMAEELWEKIGNSSSSVILGGWPVADESKRDLVAEESEDLLMNLISDLQNIIKVTKIVPQKVIIYTAAQWKFELYQSILEIILLRQQTNFGDIMKLLIEEKSSAKSNPNLVRKMLEDILSDPLELRQRRVRLEFFDEVSSVEDAKALLSLECGNAHPEVLVYSEDREDLKKYDIKSKAKFARPFKPAIHIVER